VEPKVYLCKDCHACPSVEFRGEDVRIGEGENLAVLKREEWNILVEKIKAGGKSEYQGKTYYFCSLGCKKEFDRNPAKHMKAEPKH